MIAVECVFCSSDSCYQSSTALALITATLIATIFSQAACMCPVQTYQLRSGLLDL